MGMNGGERGMVMVGGGEWWWKENGDGGGKRMVVEENVGERRMVMVGGGEWWWKGNGDGGDGCESDGGGNGGFVMVFVMAMECPVGDIDGMGMVIGVIPTVM